MPTAHKIFGLTAALLTLCVCSASAPDGANSFGEAAATGGSGASTGDASTGDASTGDASTGDDAAETATTGATVGGACATVDNCVENLLCLDGRCVETHGICQAHNDCAGDTWCCVGACASEASSSQSGVCVAYEQGQLQASCVGPVEIGGFVAAVQCEWSSPGAGDPFPSHTNVLSTPLVANLPHDSGSANEIIAITYNCTDGDASAGLGSNPSCFGVIRVFNGETCALQETIDDPDARLIGASAPAIGDLDNDGFPEIVAQTAITGLVAFKWNATEQRYITAWSTTQSDIATDWRYDGPSLHDLDDDGFPEIISGSEVYEGLTGTRLNPGQTLYGLECCLFSAIGDLDGDGFVEVIASQVHRWNPGTNVWEFAYPGPSLETKHHYAVADWGTAGVNAADFDRSKRDGVPEIVATGSGIAGLYTLEGHTLFEVDGLRNGGAPTISDFDNDGRLEFGSAGGNAYRVFDWDCDAGDSECVQSRVRWSMPSQDYSSAGTASTVFDFQGDGSAEVVYADECFLRLYDGQDGGVLYSAPRRSCTWMENPIVADTDNDENAEIVVGLNENCSFTCPSIDPIHPGLRCDSDDMCLSGACDAGLCRCENDAQCSVGHRCATPLAASGGAGNTCRAAIDVGTPETGIRVLREQLDRWTSSRPLWNQHSYSINNVNDDLTIPSTSDRIENFRVETLNNYRQNVQGRATAEQLPDITGIVENTACTTYLGGATLEAEICNRGLKAVGSSLPSTFYLGTPEEGNVLCVSRTSEPLHRGECTSVRCDVAPSVAGSITMVVNDDGVGGALARECIDTNNTDVAVVQKCIPAG